MPVSQTHEVLIVGAGPAGSALAYFLASNGISVALLDKSEFPRDKTCGDGLSPRALHVLKRMELLDSVCRTGLKITQVRFFAPDGNRVTLRMPAHDGLPDYCVILRRYEFDDMICRHAVEAGADFHPQTNVTGLLYDDGRVVGVRAHSGGETKELRAPLTVLATGAATGLLKQTGLLSKMPSHCVAARTYYEHVEGLSDTMELHYADVPLPGYGWVFPLSDTAANIGVGYRVTEGRRGTKRPPSLALERFVANSELARMLARAERRGPVKGYPIRVDFPSAVPSYPGAVVIGEATGLVNPLSGEGIDYALESAELVADLLIGNRSSHKNPNSVEEEYPRLLRNRFLSTFRGLLRVRDLYMRPFILNRLIAAANRNDTLALLLVNVGLGNLDPKKALSLKSFIKIALN